MDEEEIDSWYEEEKEKILERYTNLLMENKDRIASEKKFTQEMAGVKKEYENKFDAILKKKNVKKERSK